MHGPLVSRLPDDPKQLLPPAAYTSAEWFERERRTLFAGAWTYAGVVTDFAAPGDYAAVYAGVYPLAVVRQADGTLAAYHNLCRHRGTELLEGRGNAGSTLVCPYHRWTFGLDGGLIGMPARSACFPDLDRAEFSLKPAAVGVFKGVVFVHPDPEAAAGFDAYFADLEDAAWPHDFNDLVGGEVITYEMNCNWKVYFENAIDGYHLAYLHEHTLGGPLPSRNVWDAHGRHLVWYSTEGDGRKRSMTQFMQGGLADRDLPMAAGAESGEYGGVFMLFPTTVVSPKPYGLYLSELVPLSPDLTLLKARKWNLTGGDDDWFAKEWNAALEARDPADGRIKLSRLKKHPLETGAFRLEDIWVCEKMQRAMHSPAYSVGALAKGAGAEAPLAFFQQVYLDAMAAGDDG